MTVYSGQSRVKRFVFIRNANIGWVTGRFLQTLDHELESTIAKGTRYSR